MTRVYLGLGSNLGDRAAAIAEAARRLGEAPDRRLRILRVSSLVETEPMYVATQPWFLNAAAEAETRLSPLALLDYVLSVEQAMGRRRTVDKGPRNIDIDVLLYGSEVIDTERLCVPHPRMAERRFVLEPMAELAPQLRHPVLGLTMAELLAAAPAQAVRKYKG